MKSENLNGVVACKRLRQRLEDRGVSSAAACGALRPSPIEMAIFTGVCPMRFWF